VDRTTGWMNARAVASGLFSSARQRGETLLLIGLAALGLVANILQLASSGGSWIWPPLVVFVLVILLVFLFASPIIRRTVRGTWLFSSIRRTALVDVEHRDDRKHRLPPAAIFQAAGAQPILITGILDQLFQQNRDELVEFVRRGGLLRVLLLHPKKVAESLDRTWTRHQADWKQYWLTNCNEAQIALDGIIEADLDRQPTFKVKFLADIPPYFGMLVGDPDAVRWRHPRPFVRVQPLAVSMFVGRGSVVTFEYVPGNDCTPFAYYAKDLNAQWAVALDDPDFVHQRRAALMATTSIVPEDRA
jgi:hypothetical protein